MALIVKDRVQETSTTTGTGTFTLAGANSGFATFSSAVGNGNTTYYAIVGGTEWEVGIGTVGAGTLARTTLLASSTGSAISFSAGIKNVFCTYPAGKSVTIDDIQTLTNKTINLASNTLTGTTAQFNTALSDGDFATLAGTETLTNKALNGSLGATTPSTVVATTISGTDLTTTGNTILGNASADTLNVGNGDLIKNASGNVGIGVTPSAWNNGKAVEVSYVGNALFAKSSVDTYLTSGTYQTSNVWYRADTNIPAFYNIYNGTHIWKTGVTAGSANASYTPTQAMSLDASSNLAITGALSFGSFLGGIGKVGTFLRNSGTATGTVAYTGVGFKPSAIIFMATISGLPSESVGFTNATSGHCLWIDNTYGTGGGGYNNAIYFLRLQAGNGNYQLADISTMDADGFTLSWTKFVVGTGTPTTNISVYYLAFR
jgi:hypothetical protein